MRQAGTFQELRDALVQAGIGLAVALALGVSAFGTGIGLQMAWTLPVLVALGLVVLGRVDARPLLRPLLLLLVALPTAAILHGTLDFLWVMVGMCFTIAILSGAALGRSQARWVGNAALWAVGLRWFFTWMTPGAPGGGLAFAVAVALVWAGGAFIAEGFRRAGPLLVFLVAGATIFDRLDWILVGAGAAAATAVGRRPGRGLLLLLACALLAWAAAPHEALFIPSGTEILLRAGPPILVACFWLGGEAIAALRREWKRGPQGVVLGSAAVIGLLGAALWVTDRASEPAGLYLAAILIAVGVATERRDDGGIWELERASGGAKNSAWVVAAAMAGAALGALSVLGGTSPRVAVAAVVLLALLGLAAWQRHRPLGILLGPATFCGISLLVTRPFAMELAPGTAPWWGSTPALTALFSLAAALGGAAHAIRRPGRIGAAQVAGAVACLWLLGLLTLDDHGIAVRGDDLSLNASMGAFSVFMLFIGWAGPLDLGRLGVERARLRVLGLPVVATALALVATVFAGWS